MKRAWLVGLLALACSAAPATTPQPDPAPDSRPATTAAPSAPPDTAAPKPPPAPEPTKQDLAKRFKPAPISPPFERTAKPGDGEWQQVPLTPQVHEWPVMYRTTLHPHATRRHVRVTVVAIDLRRTRVSLVAGTEEPVVRGVPKSERTGLVPKTEFDALIAVFNGGWQTMHGRWGFMLNGRTFTKPRDVACTVALMKDDRLQIGPWPSLSDSEAQMKAYRQTPPCLIADGALHADLKGMQSSRKWGLSVEGKHAIRRSGVGLTASGDTLFYALGQETRAFHVATALQLVGARQAAELDINWIWTRFLIYEHPPDALPRIGDTLVKNLTHGKRWYVKYPQPRDFFYVTARP